MLSRSGGPAATSGAGTGAVAQPATEAANIITIRRRLGRMSVFRTQQ
jgi:hypothetical protein